MNAHRTRRHPLSALGTPITWRPRFGACPLPMAACGLSWPTHTETQPQRWIQVRLYKTGMLQLISPSRSRKGHTAKHLVIPCGESCLILEYDRVFPVLNPFETIQPVPPYKPKRDLTQSLSLDLDMHNEMQRHAYSRLIGHSVSGRSNGAVPHHYSASLHVQLRHRASRRVH